MKAWDDILNTKGVTTVVYEGDGPVTYDRAEPVKSAISSKL